MSEYDGSIRINTEIDTKDADRQLSGLESRMKKTGEAAQGLKSEMGKLKSGQIPTEEYAEISKQIEDAEKQLGKLTERQAEMENLGKDSGASWERLSAQVALYERAVRESKSDLQDLVSSGEAYSQATVSNQEIIKQLERRKELLAEIARMEQTGTGFGYAEYDSAVQELAGIDAQVKEYKNSLGSGLGETEGRFASLAERARSAFGTVSSGAKTAFGVVASAAKTAFNAVAKAAKTVYGAFKTVGNTVKNLANRLFPSLTQSAKSSIGAFSSGLKQLLQYSVGVRSLYALVGKLKTAVTEGFTNLYNYGGSFKTSVDGLKASAATLKNALAAAFEPLVSIAIPYVQKVIDYMTELCNLAAKFMASITGQKSYTRAVKQTAAALEETSNASKQLSGLDKLNNLSSGSSSGGTDYSSMFEEVPLDDDEDAGFGSWGEAFDSFLDMLLDSGIPALKSALAKLADWINNFASNLYEMFTFPGVLEKVRKLGAELGEALNEFADLIDWNTLGRALGAGFNLAINFLQSAIWAVDWIGLGGHLADAVNGLVDEVDWYVFGQLLWAKFKIALETLAGFILGLDMGELASAVSQTFIGLFDSITETIQNIDWWGLGEQVRAFVTGISWQDIADSMYAVIEAAFGAGADFLTGLFGDWETASADLESLFTSLAESINSTLASIDWGGIGSTLVTGLNTAVGALDEFIATIDWVGIGAEWMSLLQGTITTIDWGGLTSLISEALMSLLDFCIGTVTGMDWSSLWTSIGHGIIDIITNVDWLGILTKIPAIVTGCVGALLESALGLLGGIFSGIGDALVDCGADCIGGFFQGIGDALSNVGTWLQENIFNPIVNGIKNLFGIHSPSTVFSEIGGYLMEGLLNGISSLVESVGEIWDSIKEKAVEVFNTIKDKIKSIWTSVKTTTMSIWNGIWSAIKKVINSILGGIESMANGVVSGVNTIIRALNNLSFDIPDWVPALGGKSFGFSIPELSKVSLPRLATGAVVPPNKEFAAILGDNKTETEIVSPISTMKQAFAEALAEAGFTGSDDASGDYVFQVDGETFFRLMRKYAKSYKKQTGSSAFA